MKVYDDFPHRVPPRPEFPVVTLGVFDGVHRGHAHVIETALDAAAGRRVALVTFDPHPRAVLGPPKLHRLLTPIGERLTLLEKWPLAAVAVLRFDAAIAQLSYSEFVERALIGALGAEHLVLGFDLHLGHDRQGTPERLAALGARAGFAVQLVEPFAIEGRPVSSTWIRDLLDAGQVRQAGGFLGRPYALQGTVVPGHGRGRRLGVPTANVALPPEKLIPAPGVYAARAHLGNGSWVAAVNIGVAPTFGASALGSVEAHLDGFEGDLYGQTLALDLLERLRGEERFSGPEALAAQIGLDLAAARRLAGPGGNTQSS